ncbi:response regulator [Paenibacillus sp. S150]|uniref:response regulator n=1 Tax=Paenibacillus sp. S150 TaxID=2749826 RepID=UPI001C56360D|nr:response regulator [Paenibacillus sp. S150]MBW4084758.1 response regulator [Paenibacillus sp. S150]
MLTMIVADDEPFIRKSLIHVFNWQEEFGIEIIGEASDGQEAYELCMERQPDILFTDIMMPMMGGLEVAEKLKAGNCRARIIIISGAQDFSYAQSALKMNAEGYILKPVKLPELREVFHEAVTRLRQEKDHQLNFEQLRKQVQSNMPLLREKFLQNWLAGLYRDEGELWDKIGYFQLPFKRGDVLTAGVLQLDDYQSAIDKFSEEYRQLLYFSIQNMITECLEKPPGGISFVASENEFIVIFCPDQAAAPGTGAISSLCEEIIGSIKKYLRLDASIGIGRACSSASELEDSYKEALAALVHTFYTGHGSILYIKDIQPGTAALQSTFFYKFQARLMNELKAGHTQQVLELLEKLFDRLAAPKLQIDYVQSICAEIIFTSARALYELDEDIEQVLEDRLTIMDTLYRQKNISGLKTCMLSLFYNLSTHVAGKNTSKNSKTINRIRAIVQEGYARELSIARIAEEVFLTPNYISLIFKKETGETLTDYITKIRIGKAKELLHTTDLKIMEISERVGYENPHYFSTVFKKNVGVHPLKYRSGK